MKIQKPFLILAGIMLLAPVAARANDLQVWRDMEGQIVHDSSGTCVRSRWVIDRDPCAPPMPEKITWEPRPHTAIAQEDRTVYFGFNRTELTDEARQRLNALAEQLSTASDITGAKIVGYADRIGTTSYNEALSKKRAETVRTYLIGRGFIKPSMTQTRWVGKSEPSAQCQSNLPHGKLIECLQPDRKVTTELIYRTETEAGR